jgi:hypothetical protein
MIDETETVRGRIAVFRTIRSVAVSRLFDELLTRASFSDPTVFIVIQMISLI